MSAKYPSTKFTLLFLFIIAFSASTFAQGAKKPPGKKEPVVKASAKGKLAADMDCTVKINGAAKPISVKAYTPVDVVIKPGDNSVEALASDKKSTYRTNVVGKPGETVIVEISFFDDAKFLDYIKQGNLPMVETAVKKNPGLATNKDEVLTSSPLEIAIVNSQPEMVNYFLGKGASWTQPENIFPLHKSILYASNVKPAKDKPAPDKLLVELFLSKGCKITDKDDGGNTPLHCAVRAGKLEIVTMLVEKGANVNAKNDFDDLPLKIAQDKGLITIINYLKTKGAEEK